MKCRELIEILEQLAPPSLACDWDNPGLLAGRSDKEVETVFLALDATDEVIDQAVLAGADLLITHHPLIFKPLKKVNDQDFISRRILRMIREDMSYYAMHTNFDAAPGCMGDLAGECLGLIGTKVLEPMGAMADGTEYGIGVFGNLEREMTLGETARFVKEAFGIPFVTVFGEESRSVRTAAVCPGSGGSTIKEALGCKADVYITGDISHHEGIDAVACGMAVIDAGHYGIEHIFMEFMEHYLNENINLKEQSSWKEQKGKPIRILRAGEHFPSCVI